MEPLRNIVRDLTFSSALIGTENNQPIYDGSKPKPIIRFQGTVKIDGVQAGISYSAKDNIWYQSKDCILSDWQKHYGFVDFCKERLDILHELLTKSYDKMGDLPEDEDIITIFGEWAGEGVCTKAAIGNLPPSFYIYGLKLSKSWDKSWWYDYSGMSSIEHNIFNIKEFPTYEVDVDFNDIQKSYAEIKHISQQVTDECPVAKTLGVDGSGKGIIWRGVHNNHVYIFKMLGNEPIIPAVEAKTIPDDLSKYVDEIINKERVIDAALDCNIPQWCPKIHMGEVISKIWKDIIHTEIEVLASDKYERYDINLAISRKIKEIYEGLYISELDKKEHQQRRRASTVEHPA